MRLSRLGAITWGCAAVVLALRLPRLGRDVEGLASASFPTVLSSALALLLLAVAGWAVVVLGACVLGGAPARAAVHLVPRAARGLLLAGVVTALTVAGAHAGTDAAPADRGAGPDLDGLSLPDRPVSSAVLPAAPGTAAEAEPAEVLLVAPGDTLWDIAARALEPGADVAEIADAARRWYAANRDVVGADPDLIRPGQRLVVPQDIP